jgi:hypothetical protein
LQSWVRADYKYDGAGPKKNYLKEWNNVAKGMGTPVPMKGKYLPLPGVELWEEYDPFTDPANAPYLDPASDPGPGAGPDLDADPQTDDTPPRGSDPQGSGSDRNLITIEGTSSAPAEGVELGFYFTNNTGMDLYLRDFNWGSGKSYNDTSNSKLLKNGQTLFYEKDTYIAAYGVYSVTGGITRLGVIFVDDYGDIIDYRIFKDLLNVPLGSTVILTSEMDGSKGTLRVQ